MDSGMELESMLWMMLPMKETGWKARRRGRGRSSLKVAASFKDISKMI